MEVWNIEHSKIYLRQKKYILTQQRLVQHFVFKKVFFQPNTDKDEVIVNQDGMYKVEIKYHI